MMLSTQTICTCSPGIPQPGTSRTSRPVSLSSVRTQGLGLKWLQGGGLKWSSGFQNGHGYSSAGAIKQGLPFFLGPEVDASDDDEDPAKDTRVHDFTGTKTMELEDSISCAQLVDDQLPSLLSMVIDGFPPFKISKYAYEAENRLHQYAKRYPNVISLDSYYCAGLCAAAYGHPEVISLNLLVAISMNYGLQFLLDDLFFDTPNEFLQDQYGISCSALASPQKIQEYLDHLDAVYSHQVQLHIPTSLIETIIWEIGEYTLELTNLEWFNHYATSVVEHHHICVASLVDSVQGRNLYFQDVESYVGMQSRNVGAKFIQLMVEFANDSYIPSILKKDPYLEKVTTTTSIHLRFVNGIFSYQKESLLEQNLCNLITVLMEREEKPFVQAMHKAIDMVNTYAHTLVDLEAKVSNSTLRNHIQGIKALIVGNIYFSYMDYHY